MEEKEKTGLGKSNLGLRSGNEGGGFLVIWCQFVMISILVEAMGWMGDGQRSSLVIREAGGSGRGVGWWLIKRRWLCDNYVSDTVWVFFYLM